ncbi:MAG TPA: hypothetical protein VF753_09925 [Terriglobales bacterium]
MREWKINTFAAVVLIIAVGAILVLVIHPDFDPLDTAFQRNTDPLTIHNGSVAPPAAAMTVSTLHVAGLAARVGRVRQQHDVSAHPTSDSLPILNHSLRC